MHDFLTLENTAVKRKISLEVTRLRAISLSHPDLGIRNISQWARHLLLYIKHPTRNKLFLPFSESEPSRKSRIWFKMIVRIRCYIEINSVSVTSNNLDCLNYLNTCMIRKDYKMAHKRLVRSDFSFLYLLFNFYILIDQKQWRIQDFSEGVPTPKEEGAANLLFLLFGQNFPETASKWRKLGQGR